MQIFKNSLMRGFIRFSELVPSPKHNCTFLGFFPHYEGLEKYQRQRLKLNFRTLTWQSTQNLLDFLFYFLTEHFE